MDAFISHSSANRSVAIRLETAFEAAGLSVWLDHSELHLGVLLANEIQDSIRSARVLLLLWSEHAADSRWVATEWLTAFHVGRFIVPCVLDETPLPQCLQRNFSLRTRRVTASVVESLTREVRGAPDGPNELAPVMRAESPELSKVIARIAGDQEMIGEALGEWKLEMARKRQALLDRVVNEALVRWPLDPLLVNLAGYHLKNAYMLKYWDAIQAGRGGKDPLLDQSERRFLETLAIDPTDPSALNGLGSILTFQRDLDAAEFFILTAIAAAKRQGTGYPAAEGDLDLVRRYKRS
jgi:hypothetical protein